YQSISDGQFHNLTDGNGATYSLTPTEGGYYYVTLTARSADGIDIAQDNSFFFIPDATVGTPPIGNFGIAGMPTDVISGHSFTAEILAEDAGGNLLSGYTGPISVRVSDSQNNTLGSTSGNFTASNFTLGPITLSNSGAAPVTDTVTITAGNVTVSLPV